MFKKTIAITAFFCLIIVFAFMYRMGKPLALEEDCALPLGLPEHMPMILYYASLAPSGHNTQPWKVYYNTTNGTLTLSYDKARGLPHTDPDGRESLLSLGAFLENMQQAAEAYGYHPSMTIMPAFGADETVAMISLGIQAAPKADAKTSLAHMLLRHTDKQVYSALPLPEKSLKSLVESNQPYVHFYPKGSKEFAWLAHNTVEAMHTQARHTKKRVELAKWMRFSDEEARLLRDGLPAEQLGLQGIKKGIFYCIYSRKDAEKEPFAKQAIGITKDQVESAAGFFVITGPDTFAGTIRAGMHVERFWLNAVELGISLQPMSQILEETPFSDEIKTFLELEEPVQIIMRAGLNEEYGHNNRIRRTISSFTKIDKQP